MTVLTDFRLAVAARLAAITGVEFVNGMITGPVERRDLGCTFPGRVDEVEGNVDLEQLTVYARIFKKYARSTEPQKPRDPADLEQLAEQIQTALDDIQTVGTGAVVWYFRVTSVEIDMEVQGIEATIVGMNANLFHSAS